MDDLPTRSVDCADLREGLPPQEESASLVLWAWPELLGWPAPIQWLFSPVVGKRPHPGDLWGLDENGGLLIVETKLHRSGRLTDPFSDFQECSGDGAVRQHWEATPLEKRWRRLLRAERRFSQDHAATFWSGPEPTQGTFRGVLPYSRHRKAAWQWPSLCNERLVPLLEGHGYEDAVARSLKRRADGATAVTFVGVVATTLPAAPVLSLQGRNAMAALKQRGDAVLLRTLHFSRTALGRLRVDCRSARG